MINRPLTLAGLAAAAVLWTACGEEERAAAPRLTHGQQVRDRVAGTFPPKPQVRMTGPLAVRGVLTAGAAVSPGRRGTLVEAAVHPPRRGYVGAFCRGSRDAASGYAILVDRAGRVRVERREAGAVTVLRRVNLARNERSDPGEPTLLRIACGAGRPGAPATIAFTVNASPYAYVADMRSLPAGDATSAGLLSTRGSARADHAAVWLAE